MLRDLRLESLLQRIILHMSPTSRRRLNQRILEYPALRYPKILDSRLEVPRGVHHRIHHRRNHAIGAIQLGMNLLNRKDELANFRWGQTSRHRRCLDSLGGQGLKSLEPRDKRRLGFRWHHLRNHHRLCLSIVSARE